MSRPRQSGADPAAELRELIREAHGVAKDLNGLLREYRELKAQLAGDARQAAHEASSAEIKRFSRHLQGEMNRQAAVLNTSVRRAQDHILKQMTVAKVEIEHDENGGRGLRFYFDGPLFDEDYPLPDAPS